MPLIQLLKTFQVINLRTRIQMSHKKIKGIILISNVQKALEHEWFVEAVDKNELDLEFILFNSKDSELYNFIINHGFKCKNYTLRSKFFIPFYICLLWFKLVFTRYDFIHCHLFEASLIGLIAGKFAGVKKRIYTRHHSDFHHVYFPNAIKYDVLINKFSTNIIAVSDVVKAILVDKEYVPGHKISVIEHAVDLNMFDRSLIGSERIKSIKEKYKIPQNIKVIGVISRFTVWKGVQFIIPAFKKYYEANPDSILVLANANGEYKTQIMKLLNELPESSYRLISFENDSAALFQMFDMFIHVPVSDSVEAFGQVYIEALASCIPSVFTKSGIGTKILKDQYNCLIAEYSDSNSIFVAINKMINDEDMKAQLVKNGLYTVGSEFSVEKKNLSIFKTYK